MLAGRPLIVSGWINKAMVFSRRLRPRQGVRLYVGDLDVNQDMVRLGAAWVYRKYSTDQSPTGVFVPSSLPVCRASELTMA